MLPTLDQLGQARARFEAYEPRDLFYRAATELVALLSKAWRRRNLSSLPHEPISAGDAAQDSSASHPPTGCHETMGLDPMPLYANATALIHANLETIQSGRKAKAVEIGALTEVQLEAINQHRLAHNASLPLIVAEVVFIGGHVYRSRIEGDNYTIDDVVEQIVSAMSEDSALVGNLPMQAIQNPTPRIDRLGNTIHDRAVFECMSRHPRPELFSVIPKGDHIKPEKQKGRP